MPDEKINIIKNSWIDWTQLILIGLSAPFFLFPSMKFVGVLFIVPSIWICRWVVKNHFFERTILDLALIILLIQIFATCIIVPDLYFSLPKITGVLLGLAFFFSLVSLLTSKEFIRWGILVFLGAGFILSVISILSIKWDTRQVYLNKIIFKIEKIIPKIKWNLAGAEEGLNSNAIGGALILIIPLCLMLFISYLKKKKENYLISYRLLPLTFSFIIVFVMCSVLFFSLSIGSWIGLIISIWILLLSWKWKKWSLVTIFLLIALIFMFNNPVNKLLTSTLKEDIKIRKPFWAVGINTLSQHPLFGIGMNRIRQLSSVGYEHSHVHNHLLHTAAELGIPGLTAYLAILIGAGFMCFETWRKSNIGWMRMTALGLGCGQLAHFIFGMGDSIPLGAKVGIFFWLSLGLIAAMYNYMLKNSKQL